MALVVSHMQKWECRPGEGWESHFSLGEKRTLSQSAKISRREFLTSLAVFWAFQLRLGELGVSDFCDKS
jgi:hypothetical protein